MKEGTDLKPEIISRLVHAGCIAAEEEAAELLATASSARQLEEWIAQRELGVPIAWITGTTQFCGRALHVDHGVYVPRLQSEELAYRASALLETEGGRAVDLCTGSGAIALTLRTRVVSAEVVGVDIDQGAVTCARRNGVPSLRSDLGNGLRTSAFSVVTAIAPYVPSHDMSLLPRDVQTYEPRIALDGGEDGLDVVRGVVVSSARLLRKGGWLLIEVGGDQDRLLRPVLSSLGFSVIDRWSDEDGDLRGIVARLT